MSLTGSSSGGRGRVRSSAASFLPVGVGGAEAGFGIGEDVPVVGEVRRLEEVAHGCGGMQEDLARLRLGKSGGDLEERRLAGAVETDEADALAGLDLQRRAGKQRR